MAMVNLALLLSVLAPAVLASPVLNSNTQSTHDRRDGPNKIPPGLGPRPVPVEAGSPTDRCTFTTKAVPTVPPCAWDGTMTIWPTTEYATRQVDCRGCADVAVIQDLYPCPNKPVEAYTIMKEPTTCWNTVCAPSTAINSGVEARNIPAPTEAPRIVGNPELRQREDAAAPTATTTAACGTTLVVQPPQTAGKTCTHYAQTTTKTVAVSCGSCSLVVSTALAGYGPPTRFTTTITAPLAVATTYQCS